MITKEDIEPLARLLETDTIKRFEIEGLNSIANLEYTKASIKEGKKYFKLDSMGSGRYMITQEGEIYGIKAYGVIHRGHYYGTLETVNDYFWGSYKAQLKAV